MATYDLGFLIHKIRNERGLTQGQLCQGLCAVSTLSRIERGICTPSSYLFSALIERLGYSGKYQNIYLKKEDFATWQIRDTLVLAISQTNIPHTEILISEIENNKDFNKGLGLQFKLYCKISLAIRKLEIADRKNADLSQYLEMAYESLSITIPGFDENKISNYMLSHYEILTILSMSGLYFYQEAYERALQILYALKESVDKFYFDQQEKNKYYPSILANLIQTLYKIGRYEEALPLCDLGKRSCIEANKLFQAPLITEIYGQCLAELGKKDEAMHILKQTYYFYLLLDNYKNADRVSNYFFEVFKEKIEIEYNRVTLADATDGGHEKDIYIRCNKCGSKEVCKCGFVNGIQRYKCKKCGKQFIEKGRNDKAEIAKFIAAAVYISGIPLRTIEKILNVSRADVLKLVKKYTAETSAQEIKRGDAEIAELGEYIHLEKSNGCGRLLIALPMESALENLVVIIK